MGPRSRSLNQRRTHGEDDSHNCGTSLRRSAVKIQSVKFNNRKKAFEVRMRNRVFLYPYARAEPDGMSDDHVREVYVDPEIGREGFSYVLESGREGTVLADQ